jgi:acetolactate synthase-1/2/3 large subunit
MKKNLRLALALDGPVIIEAVLDPEQFFEPKLSSKQMPDGSIVSPSLEDMFPFLPFEELELIRKEAHDI